MRLFFIAWRNLQHRGLASCLTLLSMTLGVTLVVLVLSISGVLTESFNRNSNVGYNLIIGAKGSPLQLTLNTVFYLSRPIENLPYSYYLEFLSASERQAALAHAGGVLEEPDRAGVYSRYMAGGFVIPVCLGDYVGRFRAIGTTPDFFERLRYGDSGEDSYRFAAGRNFQTISQEHGFFECVVGSVVAREMGLKVGDQVVAAHGDVDGEIHEDAFTVVGILAPTGTPNDRAAFLNIEGFYLLENHQAPLRDAETGQTLGAAQQALTDDGKLDLTVPLPIEQREVTALLLNTAGPLAMGLDYEINKSTRAQAASPIREVASMLETFFEPARWTLLALTLLVCVVSAVSILVSIYNSMSQRSRDIAVMRALGASRDKVLWIILCEAILIAVGGGLLGVLLGHSIGALLSPLVEARTGIRIGLLTTHKDELWIIPGLILVGILAGLLPAVVAYRTDVSRSLAA